MRTFLSFASLFFSFTILYAQQPTQLETHTDFRARLYYSSVADRNAAWGPTPSGTLTLNYPGGSKFYDAVFGTGGTWTGFVDNTPGDPFQINSLPSGTVITASVTGCTDCPTSYFFTSDGSTFAPLPVELISFRGAQQGEIVNLEWMTASEINNEYFVIERSTDGMDFYQVGKISGNGTTLDFQEYEFVDNRVPLINNKIYYRLRQIDYDGQSSYPSKTIAIELDNAANLFTSNSLIVSKGSSSLLVNGYANEGGSYNILVYNTSGHLLGNSNLELEKGNAQFDVSLNSTASAMLIVIITNGSASSSYKVFSP